MNSRKYLFLITTLSLFSTITYPYQAYWVDSMQRNFSDGAKIYDQTVFRVGGTASRNQKAIWGKIDQIHNNSFGSAQSIDGGGLYRYQNTSTTLGLGFGNDFHLRSNRLYVLEQRLYLKNESLIPYIGIAQEEYLGTPQSIYTFTRGGLGIKFLETLYGSVQFQKIDNHFSDSTSDKKGIGAQFTVNYQREKGGIQLGWLRNCLGESRDCKGSRDQYEEYLSNIQIRIKDNWALRINASYIKQSSRFVSPFSNVILNNNTTHSEIVGVGIIKIIP